MSNPLTAPSNHTASPWEHIHLNFYFIPNHPNYISKLNLPMNLANSAEKSNTMLVINIKLVEDHLQKQNELKKANKNETKNKKTINYKLRFT